jgi:hypothetical protein
MTGKFLAALPALLLGMLTGMAQVPFPPLEINDQVHSAGVHFYSSPSEIISPADNTVVSFNGTSHTELLAANNIRLLPGFSANAFSSGDFLARIGQDFEMVLIPEPGSPAGIYKLEKMEVGIALPEELQSQIDMYLSGAPGLNPYDPDDISIYAGFQQGADPMVFVNGFYYQDFAVSGSSWTSSPTEYPWRLRFAPPKAGEWKATVLVAAGGVHLFEGHFSFTCLESGNRGYLERGQFGQRLRFSESKEGFFAIGQNIAWPTNALTYSTAEPAHYDEQRANITDLKQRGGNFFRIVLAPWSNAIEFEKMGDYSARQPHLWELDRIIDQAHDYDMFIQLCLEMHTQWELSNPFGAPSWSQNPYNSANQTKIPGIAQPVDFFTSPAAAQEYQKKLRYFFARYGYSTNLAVTELFSEIDKIANYNDPAVKAATLQWHGTMLSHIKSSIGAKQLLSTSFSDNPDPSPLSPGTSIFSDPNLDVTNRHHYANPTPADHSINYDSRYNAMVSGSSTYGLDHFMKPSIFGEMGGSTVTGELPCEVEFHSALWSTAFMGGYGAGLQWWKWEDDDFRKHLGFKQLLLYGAYGRWLL